MYIYLRWDTITYMKTSMSIYVDIYGIYNVYQYVIIYTYTYIHYLSLCLCLSYTVIIDIRSYYLNFVVEPLWGFEAPNSHCLFLTKVFSIGSRGGWGKLDEGLHNVKVCNIPKYLANFVRSHSTSGCPYFSKLFQSFLYISSWVSVLYTYIYIYM